MSTVRDIGLSRYEGRLKFNDGEELQNRQEEHVSNSVLFVPFPKCHSGWTTGFSPQVLLLMIDFGGFFVCVFFIMLYFPEEF